VNRRARKQYLQHRCVLRVLAIDKLDLLDVVMVDLPGQKAHLKLVALLRRDVDVVLLKAGTTHEFEMSLARL
jgi:hypothetical protein